LTARDDDRYVSRMLTAPGVFTAGAEGPACDDAGNIFAVNFAREGTIGRVTPEGEGSVFLELPHGSVGNGIRFDRGGDMFIADYTNHNILRIDMETQTVSVYAHDPALNQPNDLTIDVDGTLFASDPNWQADTGQFWRIGDDRIFVRMETGMSTTNGIEIDVRRRLLYLNETTTRRIWVYDLPLGGMPTDKRLLIEFPDFALDGMRLDAEGNLFVARWSKGTVAANWCARFRSAARAAPTSPSAAPMAAPATSPSPIPAPSTLFGPSIPVRAGGCGKPACGSA
jgi:gluconolactonase